MRIDYNHIKPQIDELITSYGGLKEENTDKNTSIILSGRVSINRSYNGFTVDKEYDIRILIPLNNDELPDVWDIGNHIDKSYIHRYPDGELCLETKAFIALCFYNGCSLLQWMENIVEPYYYSYEYFSRFGEFPYGDRGHDLVGVIETYQQIFDENDCAKVYKLLQAISRRKYKGHLPCPCESGLITRRCHGRFIYPYISDDYLFSIAKNDYSSLCEAIKEYDKQSNH